MIFDFVDCIWFVFDIIYKMGGWWFVLLNEVFFEFLLLYVYLDNGGIGDS